MVHEVGRAQRVARHDVDAERGRVADRERAPQVQARVVTTRRTIDEQHAERLLARREEVVRVVRRQPVRGQLHGRLHAAGRQRHGLEGDDRCLAGRDVRTRRPHRAPSDRERHRHRARDAAVGEQARDDAGHRRARARRIASQLDVHDADVRDGAAADVDPGQRRAVRQPCVGVLAPAAALEVRDEQRLASRLRARRRAGAPPGSPRARSAPRQPRRARCRSRVAAPRGRWRRRRRSAMHRSSTTRDRVARAGRVQRAARRRLCERPAPGRAHAADRSSRMTSRPPAPVGGGRAARAVEQRPRERHREQRQRERAQQQQREIAQPSARTSSAAAADARTSATGTAPASRDRGA